jgi:hypothetical protein
MTQLSDPAETPAQKIDCEVLQKTASMSGILNYISGGAIISTGEYSFKVLTKETSFLVFTLTKCLKFQLKRYPVPLVEA